ncbi:DUF2812 domain-containing protein [Paenibacillus macerans]|uniref:DUF2812 domain-containing protein n=1 Tax=Paenibacillus macerans TaxID=44252 RepID=UPI003D3123B8
MSEKKTVLLSAFRYVIPAQYEQWFEELAAEGWHPAKVGQWSSLAMRFVKGTPERYRYVVDLQAMPQKGYKQIYEEFGWEYVGRMSSAFVWRKKYAGERPESFSDRENLEVRNKRFIQAISFSFFIFALIAVIVTVSFACLFQGLTAGETIQFWIGIAVSWPAAVYLGWVMRKIKHSLKS